MAFAWSAANPKPGGAKACRGPNGLKPSRCTKKAVAKAKANPETSAADLLDGLDHPFKAEIEPVSSVATKASEPPSLLCCAATVLSNPVSGIHCEFSKITMLDGA